MRRRILASIGKSLPYDEELVYLSANGNQYIDTEEKFLNGFKIDIRIMPTESSGDSRLFFGSYQNPYRNFIGFNYVSSNKEFVCGFGGNAYSYCGRARGELNVEYDIVADFIGNEKSAFSLVSNGVDTPISVTGTPGARGNVNCLLFAGNGFTDSTHIFKGRIYRCKLWDERTAAPKLDFIPVLKDGVPCLYDIIGGGFFYNRISGHQFGFLKKDGSDPVDPY